jgi:curved DNA-binding protein CbpA
MGQEDYYKILGVEKDSPSKGVKEAYRRLAFQYHPDKNKDNPAAVERMKQVNEAYAVLSDAQKRKEYDALKEQHGFNAYDRFKQSYSEQDIFRGSDVNQVFEEMSRAFGFRGFNEVFRECYGAECRTFEFKRPGVFARGFVFFGPTGQRRGQAAFSREETGTSPGTIPGRMGKLTQVLLKKMFKAQEGEKGKDWHDRIAITPRTAREGGKMKYDHRKKSRELLITIPPGVRPGQKIRLKGMGGKGKYGGEPGDLYLNVQIQKPLAERIMDFFKALIPSSGGKP